MPSTLRADARRRVCNAVRRLLQNRDVHQGKALDLDVELPVPISIQHARPEAGQVTEDTDVSLTTSTRTDTDNGDDDVPPLKTTPVPDPSVRDAFDAIVGYDEITADLLNVTQKLAEHRPQFADVASDLDISGKYLFIGPPGTGKTTTARGVADRFGRAMGLKGAVHNVHTPRLMDKYLGESSENVFNLFDWIRDQSRRYDYSVVVFDEVDSIAGDRTQDQDHADGRRAVNSILMAMDRLNYFDHGVFLFAVSNLAGKMDPAVIRRFDETYHFPLPDAEQRCQILNRKSRRLLDRFDLEFDLDRQESWDIIQNTTGYSGADLSRLVSKALFAALDNGRRIDHGCFQTALSKIKPPGETAGRDRSGGGGP